MIEQSPFEIEGKQAYQKKKYKKAAMLFKKAEEYYLAQNEIIKSAEMANNRSVVLLQAGKAEEAFQAAFGTDEIFKDHGVTLQQALAIGNIAAALEAQKRYDLAETEYERCVEILKELGEAEYLPDVMKSLSDLRLKDKRHYEAAASLKSSLEFEEKLTLKQKITKFILGKFLKRLN